jgi:hypothetical protein
VRVLGTRHGQRQGLVSAELAGTRISLRQTLNVEPGDDTLVQIRGELVIGFRNGRRLSADSARSVSEVSYPDP